MSENHISDDQLNAYLLGRLADSEHGAVEEHLDQCSECERRAANTVPRDPLVGLLASIIELDSDQSRHADEALNAGMIASGEGVCNGEEESSLGPAYQPPGELLNHGRYRVIRPLGSGGMGMVWLAEHLVMRRLVAVKVARPEWLGKAGAMERFGREVHAVAKLNHPNVVGAYDAERTGDVLFLVSEYIDGETLAELLLDGPLSVVDACRAARDAALGLAHAHAAGLVHRDIKPGNLLRNREGIVKVLDFGLVTAFHGNSSLTAAKMLVGTPDYVAPEQAEDPTRADARSDIYSLGCTLYHLLGGGPPFPTPSTLKKLDAHRYAAAAPLDDVPLELQRIVSRMMAKSPSDRFQSAAGVCEALRPFCEDHGPIDSVTGSRPAPGESSRRATLLTGLGLVAVFVALSLYSRFNRKPNSPPPQPGAGVTPAEPRLGQAAPAVQPPSATRTFPLLEPTAIAAGRQQDFHVADGRLTIYAMQESPQVWLDFDVVRSRQIIILTRIRFIEAKDDANLKLVFLAHPFGDYSFQIRPGQRRFAIQKAQSSTRTLLGEYRLPDEFGGHWMNVEFRLQDNHMTAVVEGREVIKVPCEANSPFYPCIAAINCAVELSEPRAEVLE